MSTSQNSTGKMTNFRWIICAMLFFATTVNYLDRQVLSLTWKDFIAPEFHWTDSNYGDIAAIFLLYMPLPTYLPGVSLTGWVPKRLSLGYRCMVVGGLYACTLRLGNRTDTGYTQCRRNDLRHRSCCFYHCHHQRVLFHCGTHRAGNR